MNVSSGGQEIWRIHYVDLDCDSDGCRMRTMAIWCGGRASRPGSASVVAGDFAAHPLRTQKNWVSVVVASAGESGCRQTETGMGIET